MPATFVAHSMAITFDMGSCTFNDSKWLYDDVKVGRRAGAGRAADALARMVARPASPRSNTQQIPSSLPHPPPQELDCIEPSISYVKSPANFTSKYHSAPA